MNYLNRLLLCVLTVSLLCISCNQEEAITPASDPDQSTISNPSTTTSTDPCGTALTSTFYAGQNIAVGTVTISNNATNLTVTITTQGGWVMGQTHVYVGSLANMPSTPNGNPKIGNFPSSTTHSPMVTTYSYTYDLSTLDSCFIVATHAEVHLLDVNGDIIQSETAWANDTQLNTSGSWAGYMSYCIQECAPCVYTTISHDLFGGQTILAGNVEITNDATNLYVTYNTTGGWSLTETHLYVGSLANLPTNNANTPIPGQFTYQANHIQGTTTYTYTIPLSSIIDPCYIVATHAAISRDLGGGDLQEETAWSFGDEFPNTTRWGWYNPYCTQICD